MTDAGQARAAVVGTGFIGLVHVEALRRLGVEITGIVGSSPERVREKARSYPLPEPYESYEAMLADPRVDVVHITSPNHLHHPQAKAALEAGKHVVCEKPLGMDSAQTGELLRLARDSGLVHAVNFNIRFYPQCREARERVAAGTLGDVRLVTGSYLQDWLMYDTDWNWRLEQQRGGALRAVGDIGSHWIDLLTAITGDRVESVMADLTTFMPRRRQPTGPVETFSTEAAAASETVSREIDTEDTASILLRFAGGARGAVTVSQLSAGRKNALSFEIDGSRSAVAWMAERPEELWIGHRDEPNQVLLRDPSLLTPAAAALASVPGGHAEGFENTFRELYRAVYRAVAAGGPPDEPDYPTFADGHEQTLIGEAIAASAREGRWTDVDRTTIKTEDPT
ncbi:MAG TPA: Gfo/Idh/MocA family oxidoreductase [Baekduia sp.]|nr:Gfo/Idh/MocA family oxidoreductase [Baekduia sp.]